MHHVNTVTATVLSTVHAAAGRYRHEKYREPKIDMPLTDTAIRQARPGAKPIKMTDGDGLFLLLQPTGSKLWRYDYRFAGKRKTLAIGAYSAVSLAAARKALAAAREQLAAGTDPAATKKDAKRTARLAAENSFEAVARSWWSSWKTARTEGTAYAAIRALENHVFRVIGSKPITTVQPVNVLELLRKIEAKGATDMLKRVRARISAFVSVVPAGRLSACSSP